MLVLTRKLNQEIRIGENIVVQVLGIRENQVRLGIVAPTEVPVVREEILRKAPSSSGQPILEARVMKCVQC